MKDGRYVGPPYQNKRQENTINGQGRGKGVGGSGTIEAEN